MKLAGAITDGAFVMPIRVYYGDTDAGGIVYHANYLTMAERCRTEMLRAFDHPLVGPNGENFIVKSAQINWSSPARLDDLIICQTQVQHIGAASVDLCQSFSLNDRALCEINLTLVHVSDKMKPIRLGTGLRDAFASLKTAQSQP